MTATGGAIGATRAHVALAAFALASLVAFVTLVAAMLILGIWSAPLVSALTPVASDLDLTNSQVPAAVEGSAQ